MNWEKLEHEINKNNWEKASTLKGYAISKTGSPLFFMQKSKNNEGSDSYRIVFNSPLANQFRLDFNDIVNGFKTIENDKRKNLDIDSVHFKDKDGYNMQFNRMQHIFSNRFWEDQAFKGKSVKAATFSHQDTAEAFLTTIEKNLLKSIDQYPDVFEKVSTKIKNNFDHSIGQTKKMII